MILRHLLRHHLLNIIWFPLIIVMDYSRIIFKTVLGIVQICSHGLKLLGIPVLLRAEKSIMLAKRAKKFECIPIVFCKRWESIIIIIDYRISHRFLPAFSLSFCRWLPRTRKWESQRPIHGLFWTPKQINKSFRSILSIHLAIRIIARAKLKNTLASDLIATDGIDKIGWWSRLSLLVLRCRTSAFTRIHGSQVLHVTLPNMSPNVKDWHITLCSGWGIKTSGLIQTGLNLQPNVRYPLITDWPATA